MKKTVKYYLEQKQGFTLIEMILAVSILMLVFLAAGTGLMIVQQTWIKSQNRSDQLKRLILIDKIVNANFTNIIPFEWRDEQLSRKEIFLGNPEKVIFATTHPVNIARAGAIRFVAIYVENNCLVVSYSNTPLLNWDENVTPQSREIISEGVSKVEFLYADFDNEKKLIWENDWDEEKRRNIPLAIQMTVNWEDGARISWLKRTAGAGKREYFGRRYNDRTQ